MDTERKDNGQFKTGHAKMGGVKRGQQQRTKEMIHKIFDMVEKDFYNEETGYSQFEADFEKLKPMERRQVMHQLLKVVMPSITSVSIEDNKTVSSLRELMTKMAGYKRTKDN